MPTHVPAAALAALPLALPLLQDGAAEAPAPAPAPRFAPPVPLVVDGDPLGAGRPYPSPRLLDIDGDGAPELVIGDLAGRVTVSERAEEGAPLAWTAPEPIVTDGRELKFHNW